ncbi:hypothetical protein AEQ67_18570 [Pseudomonas sp. RIT-PI-q]|nr:hypothetical protein AEQ67_18570 [Pseudomonas sp. RIT-PI-q]
MIFFLFKTGPLMAIFVDEYTIFVFVFDVLEPKNSLQKHHKNLCAHGLSNSVLSVNIHISSVLNDKKWMQLL